MDRSIDLAVQRIELVSPSARVTSVKFQQVAHSVSNIRTQVFLKLLRGRQIFDEL